MTVFLGGAGAVGLGLTVAVGFGDGFFVELLGLGVVDGVGVGLAVVDSDGLGDCVGPLGTPLVWEGGSSLKMNPSPRSWSEGPPMARLIPKMPKPITATTANEATIRRNVSFPMPPIVPDAHEI